MMLFESNRKRCLNYFGIDGIMLQILEENACSRR